MTTSDPTQSVPVQQLLHDLQNIVGLLTLAAADLERAREANEEEIVDELVADLVSYTALATEVLRILGPTGRSMHPCDLRAIVYCARVFEARVTLPATLRAVKLESEAGHALDAVMAVVRAAGESLLIEVTQSDDGNLCLRTESPDHARLAAEAAAAAADKARLRVTADGADVRLSPR